MDEQKRKRRIDTWLQKLHRDHPVLAWLLVFGGALGVLIVAMLLRAFLEWLGR